MKKNYAVKVAMLAACDRNNYGDVLLPIVLEQYLVQSNGNAIIDCFAMQSSDLSDIGGLKTQPKGKINTGYDAVIVAGGAVLSAKYLNMFTNLQDDHSFLLGFVNRIAKRSSRLAEIVCRILLQGHTALPWSVLPKTQTQLIAYNAVSGGLTTLTLVQKRELKKVIEQSTFFSVRDKVTYQAIAQWGLQKQVKLIPDTAIVMSDLFSHAALEPLCSAHIIQQVQQANNYFVLQVNQKFGQKIVRELAWAIDTVYDTIGLQCVLLPIGRAEGHDDIIPLTKIKEIANENAAVLIEENNIYDVMYLIANASAYVGSSLHGAITAASYEIAHTAVSPEAWKLIGFLETWQTSSTYCVADQHELVQFIQDTQQKQMIDVSVINEMKRNVRQYLNQEVQAIQSIQAKNT